LVFKTQKVLETLADGIPGSQWRPSARDGQQAQTVAELVGTHLLHLPYESGDLRMLPKSVFDDAKPLFERAR
jgi:hypothetical protein